jgi:phosphotransferase system  glucose/maltose/N-acetylglucosamine-specific IIC component
MGWLEDLINVVLYQLGLKFLIPFVIFTAILYLKTGKTWIPLVLGAACGLIFYVIATSLGY